jgi:hypothetical protein
VILGEPTPKEVKKLNALLGCDVTGFQRMIDISAVKHSRKKHPNMTETDFCLIPMIISAADEITKGTLTPWSIVKRWKKNTIMWNAPVLEGKGWP